jgi:hypothetical protein
MRGASCICSCQFPKECIREISKAEAVFKRSLEKLTHLTSMKIYHKQSLNWLNVFSFHHEINVSFWFSLTRTLAFGWNSHISFWPEANQELASQWSW